jgi:hypothetical protein
MPCPPVHFDWLSWASWSCLRQDVTPLATFFGAAVVAWSALKQARTASLRHKAQSEADLASRNADRESRITESFIKATEQLGSDKLEIRLGCIYTFERIAIESQREYWPVVETLTAYHLGKVKGIKYGQTHYTTDQASNREKS